MVEGRRDPDRVRYGCFLPDLTGLAKRPVRAVLPRGYMALRRALGKRNDRRSGSSWRAGGARGSLPAMRNGPPYRPRPAMAFEASRLDRRERVVLAAARKGPDAAARFLLFDAKGRVLVEARDPPAIVRLSRDEARARSAGPAVEVFLGRDATGADHWARRPLADEHGDAGGERASGDPGFPEGWTWRDARGLALAFWPVGATGAPDRESGDLAAALALTNWHLRHRFCAVCGRPSEVVGAGWMRRCPGCGAEHFPRTDPVVIMLPVREGRALLARQPHFPPGMHSALAGFVAPGESLEAAVAREISEETGLALAGRPRYVASQAWPFPTSLMVGFLAPVARGAVRLDGAELEAARWFSCAEAARALEGSARDVFAPPPMAIAHHLIRHWLAEEGWRA